MAREQLGIPQDAKVVFAFGGSQGARTINRGIVDAIHFVERSQRDCIARNWKET